jgi:hypothetical protein
MKNEELKMKNEKGNDHDRHRKFTTVHPLSEGVSETLSIRINERG